MKITRITYQIIKWIITILAFLFIINKIYYQINNGNVLDGFYNTHFKNIHYLALALILMPVNWATETYKWKELSNRIQNISYKIAFKAVWSGITVSFFTPNRIGCFAGRMLVFDKKNRVKAIFTTLIAGFAQSTITLTAGLTAIILLKPSFISNYFGSTNSNLFYIGIILMITTCLIFYYRIINIAGYMQRFIKKEKTLKFISFIKTYKPVSLKKTLILSALRFFIFSIQFYFLLLFFGINIYWINGLLNIFLIFFITTFLPTFALTEIGIRGSVAIFILGKVSDFTVGILSASLLLWIINLAIPALFGTFFLYNFKEKKSRFIYKILPNVRNN